MPGLADLFGLNSGSGGGGMFGGPAVGGGIFGDMLTPEQKQALAYRGLMAAAAALGQAAMPSRMPIPIGAALGQAAGAMGEAQDKGAETALKAGLYGLQGQQLKAKIGLMNQYANDTPPPMYASTPSGAPQPLVPAPVAPGADTLGTGGVPKAVSTMTADATMEPVQRAFLDSIAGPESAGAYNIRYTPSGGTTFAGYDAHPNIPEPGPQGPSTAAGRYQIVNSTWKPLADQLGLSDFSPVSQDQAAWTLASNTYQKSTGRDLLADLKAGRTQDIPSALGGQWPTIRKAMPAFAANLAKYGQAGTAETDATLPAVPDFGGMFAGNQGPGYAPVGMFGAAPPTGPLASVLGGMPAGGINVGRLIMDPSLPNNAEGRAAAAPMSQLSAAYANAVGQGFRGTIQDFAQQQQAAPQPQAATAGAPAAQPGPLAQVLSPQPPSGGMFGQPPAPSGPMYGQPAAMPAMPGGTAPGMTMGGINPAYVQWAQRRANQGSFLGIPTPGYLNEAAGMPFVGPKAAATAGAQYPYDIGKMREQTGLDIYKAGPIAGSQAAAKQPYDIQMENLKTANAIRQGLAAQGINLGPGGVNMPAPGYQQTIAGQKGAVAQAEAEAQQNAIMQREQAMARFNVNPNAIDLGGGLRSGGAFPGGAGGTAPAAAPAPTPTAPAYGGLGVTEPLPTSHGTVIPPVAAAAPIVGSPEYLKAKQSGKGGWADTEQEWSASRGPAKKAEQAAFAVADALKKFQSGAAAGELADVQAKLRAVGIDLPDRLLGNSAEAQKIVKYNFSQTISSMKGFDSNPAAYQIKLAFENWANTNLQPEANLAILAQSVGLARWQEKLQQDFSEAKKYGWRDPQDFMLKWDQVPTNSLQSFVARAEQEIGPLKGAPGAPPGSTPRRSYYDPRTRRIVPQE